ncbi:hypothetical protein KXW05_003298 [Aspergillus fumigatus]|nr:hypothetical protein KXV33_009551 [Aspergillus fumigatus]KAH2780637.1 hypothetical protein KXW05_003298 [Aspergillus fumigatus]KAH3131422.1 hypothetical protein KXV82_009329 [Aspergillus fumigatus]KAH3422133.1 hypothetical protein KXW09_000519 [Aspergillus fumigatus]
MKDVNAQEKNVSFVKRAPSLMGIGATISTLTNIPPAKGKMINRKVRHRRKLPIDERDVLSPRTINGEIRPFLVITKTQLPEVMGTLSVEKWNSIPPKPPLNLVPDIPVKY